MLNLASNVIVFADGEEALSFLNKEALNKQNLPDVIFLDVNMPLMDGWEFMNVYKEVKKLLTKDIKIYMASSSIDDRDKAKAESIQDIDDFIVKPIEEEKLKELLLKD
jgi:CheY-like chemotaxis protein